MAWIDNRIWCHPKLVGLSDKSFRAFVNGIAYSSGFGTYGVLDEHQLRAIGSTKTVRNELVSAKLWHEISGGIQINDWDDHNGKRDAKIEARRKADRERKRLERAKKRVDEPSVSGVVSAGLSDGRPVDCPQDVTVNVLARGRAGARVVTVDRLTVEGSKSLEVSDPSFLPSPATDGTEGRIFEFGSILKDAS